MSNLRQAAQQALEALAIADNIALVGAAYTPKSIDLGLRKIRDSAIALRTALEQQAEPEAWLYKTVDGLFVSDQQPSDVEVWNDIEWSKPFYPTPPQRKPLTDEEIMEMYGLVYVSDVDGYSIHGRLRFARAIEAAHNIKEAV